MHRKQSFELAQRQAGFKARDNESLRSQRRSAELWCDNSTASKRDAMQPQPSPPSPREKRVKAFAGRAVSCDIVGEALIEAGGALVDDRFWKPVADEFGDGVHLLHPAIRLRIHARHGPGETFEKLRLAGGELGSQR